MTPGMLIAYDEDGNIIQTRDFQVVYDPDTLEPLGLADFIAHENAGGENTDWWQITVCDFDKDGAAVPRQPQPVIGSKAWPEWLGGEAHRFRVVLAGPPGNKRIVKLVHKKSRHERTREAVEAAIAERRARTPEGQPVDLRDVLGGPDRPLLLDAEGRNRPRPAKSQRPALPVVRVGRGSP